MALKQSGISLIEQGHKDILNAFVQEFFDVLWLKTHYQGTLTLADCVALAL